MYIKFLSIVICALFTLFSNQAHAKCRRNGCNLNPVKCKMIKAVKINDLETVQKLIIQGQDVNTLTSSQTSILNIATQNGFVDIVQELINSGADINIATLKGNTPLITAAEHNHYETVITLLEAGANSNIKNKKKLTPLMLAANNGSLKIIKALLERDIALDSQDTHGKTALMHCICGGDYEEIASLLIDAGSNTQLKNSKRQNALDLAKKFNRKKIADLLSVE